MTIVNVQDPQFGAKGDGATNDTAAITAADAYARSLNPPARVYFPSGIYMVSQLVLYTNSNWRGEGKNSTTLRQISGSNTDLLYGVNSNANWGSTQPAAFPYNITLQELTLDGNWNAGAGNTSGSGLSVFGDRFVLN
jgi:polygalacturonase